MKTTNSTVDDLTAEAQDLGMYTDPEGMKMAMDSGSYRTWLQGLERTELATEFSRAVEEDTSTAMDSILFGEGPITKTDIIEALVEKFERDYRV